MTQWGLDTLFNPAKRHMDDEKQRLQATREEVGDASGGKRIDFASGKVLIRRGTARPAESVDDEADTDQADTDQEQPNSISVAQADPASPAETAEQAPEPE